jgi:hypothetical protein
VLLFAALVVSAGGTAAAVAAGTPLNARYLLLPAVLCLLLCGLALGGWTQLPRDHRGRRIWQAVAAGVAVLLIATAPHELRRLDDVRDRVGYQAAVAGDARTAIVDSRCGRLSLVGGRPAPLAALALDRPATQFAVTHGRAPARGLLLAPRDQRVAREYLLLHGAPRPPRGMAVSATTDHWRLYGRCGGSI